MLINKFENAIPGHHQICQWKLPLQITLKKGCLKVTSYNAENGCCFWKVPLQKCDMKMSLKADVGKFVWKKNNWEMPWKMLFINDNENAFGKCRLKVR